MRSHPFRWFAFCGLSDALQGGQKTPLTLLPSLSDEQPRIAYEALSQAVPIIGSATGGIREVVESAVNGRLSPPNDVERLAASFIWAGGNRAELKEMGLRGLMSVRQSTHKAMHRDRHALLLRALSAR
jgi:glycosyltransferase involved in cell wall biosynthesis